MGGTMKPEENEQSYCGRGAIAPAYHDETFVSSRRETQEIAQQMLHRNSTSKGEAASQDLSITVGQNSADLSNRKHNVRLMMIYTGASTLFFSICQWNVFDAYLSLLAQDKGYVYNYSWVGFAESISGLVALVLAIPVGIMVDKYSRVKLCRWSAVIGVVASVISFFSFAFDNIAGLFLNLVLWGVYSEVSGSTTQALFADSLDQGGRSAAMTTNAMVSAVGLSLGPAILVGTFYLTGNYWTLQELHVPLLLGCCIGPISCALLWNFKPIELPRCNESPSSPAHFPAEASGSRQLTMLLTPSSRAQSQRSQRNYLADEGKQKDNTKCWTGITSSNSLTPATMASLNLPPLSSSPHQDESSVERSCASKEQKSHAILWCGDPGVREGQEQEQERRQTARAGPLPALPQNLTLAESSPTSVSPFLSSISRLRRPSGSPSLQYSLCHDELLDMMSAGRRDWETREVDERKRQHYGFRSRMYQEGAEQQTKTRDNKQAVARGKKHKTQDRRWYSIRAIADISIRNGRWKTQCVPYVVMLSDIIRKIGAGMTVKFFTLFFMKDYNFLPIHVSALFCVYPLCISLCMAGIQAASKVLGRAQAVTVSQLLGVISLIAMAYVRNVWVLVVVFLLRGAFSNAVYPIDRSIIMDYVPSHHRGKWNAVESLTGMTWSGSAVLGGLLSDTHDFRYTFTITAQIYTASLILYLPLLWLVPRNEEDCHRSAKTKIGGLQSNSNEHPCEDVSRSTSGGSSCRQLQQAPLCFDAASTGAAQTASGKREGSLNDSGAAKQYRLTETAVDDSLNAYTMFPPVRSETKMNHRIGNTHGDLDEALLSDTASANS